MEPRLKTHHMLSPLEERIDDVIRAARTARHANAGTDRRLALAKRELMNHIERACGKRFL